MNHYICWVCGFEEVTDKDIHDAGWGWIPGREGRELCPGCKEKMEAELEEEEEECVVKIADFVLGLTSREDAMRFLGDLLTGAYKVDVNTDELEEDGDGAWKYGPELVFMLEALGVVEVPRDILFAMGDRGRVSNTYLDVCAIRVFDRQSMLGFMASLLDGCTIIHKEDIYVCYGEAPQSYAPAEAVLGDDISAEDLSEHYRAYWEDVLPGTKHLVVRLLMWIR